MSDEVNDLVPGEDFELDDESVEEAIRREKESMKEEKVELLKATPIVQAEVEEEKGVDELDKEEMTQVPVDENPDDNIPDLSDAFIMTSAMKAELEAIFVNSDMSPDNLLKEESTNGKLFRLAKAYSLISKAVELNYEMLEGKDLQPLKDVCPSKHSYGKKYERHTTIEDEEEALLQLTARLNSVKKLRLVNSGFYITLKKLSVGEIKAILDQIDDDGKIMGRILGGHFYTLSDYFYVQQISAFLKHIVGGSNLNKWNHGNNLIKFISLNDFNLILGALGEHLFMDGVKYLIECPEESCSYTEKIKLDIADTAIVEWSRLPEEAIKRLFSDDEFTVKDYFKYQELIGASDSVNVTEKIEMKLKVPTIFTFLKHGDVLMARLINALYKDDAAPTDQQMMDYRVLNYYKNFLGWIEKVVCHPVDENDKGCTITKKRAIEELLEPAVWEKNEERTKFLDFFKKSSLVHHGVLGKQCPKCGRVPNPKTNGYIALDMHNFFYNLSAFHLLRSLSS